MCLSPVQRLPEKLAKANANRIRSNTAAEFEIDSLHFGQAAAAGG